MTVQLTRYSRTLPGRYSWNRKAEARAEGDEGTFYSALQRRALS
jgi:hypothetical protein